ncbi:MAG: hypothetical protein U5N56_02505 [Candidatus Marinimicrobia bacterium]|nr:hypothetical protein [Candidatus Neomarinimicrobiota bacterium]
MRKILIGIVLFIAVRTVFSADTLSLVHYPWIKIHYEGDAEIINKTCDRLPQDDPFYRSRGDSAKFIKVMEYVPGNGYGDRYSILFSMGESADPRYYFYRNNETLEEAFSIHTVDLYLKNGGVIIARGSVNEMFTLSRKFLFKKGKIKEIKQPFYAVDLQSSATGDFPVYRTKRLRRAVTTVRKGEEISVLLTEFDENYRYYLIRSSTGLCGWIKVEKGVWVNNTPIKDLYYHGD